MCEMFAATNHHMTFNDLNRIAAWQIIQGINFIVPHAVHHRFREVIKFFAPPVFNWTTLEEGVREFNDNLAFNCMAAAEGEYVADYAIKNMFKGKLIIVPGFIMKVARFFQTIMPEKLVLRICYNIQKKKIS